MLPPVPPPAGGWPAVQAPTLDQVRRLLPAPDVVVQATTYQPRPDAGVLLLAVTDPAQVEAAVAPWLGRSVFVVRSRVTAAERETAREHLVSRANEWRLDYVASSSDPDGQPVVRLMTDRVLPGLAEWARTQPDGLFAVECWLRPMEPR